MNRVLLASVAAILTCLSTGTLAASPLRLSARYRWNSGGSRGLASNGIAIQDTVRDGNAEVLVTGVGRGGGHVGMRFSELANSEGPTGEPDFDAPGSHDIHIHISPEVGKTRYAGLVFRRPCVLAVAEDGTLLSSRPGVFAGDRDGRLWRSRPVQIRGKRVNAFFREGL